MSNYDYRPNYDRGPGPMDYAGTNSGGGIWTFIGLIAVVALIGLILFGAATSPDGTPDGAVAPAAAPAAPVPEG
ncbi:MAG: hypothetical protein AAFY77_09995 [Pseudomonadota bacterium]